MAGGKPDRHRHGCAIDQSVQDDEQVEQQDEARSPGQVDAAEQCRAMRPVAKMSSEDHPVEIDGRYTPYAVVLGSNGNPQKEA